MMKVGRDKIQKLKVGIKDPDDERANIPQRLEFVNALRVDPEYQKFHKQYNNLCDQYQPLEQELKAFTKGYQDQTLKKMKIEKHFEEIGRVYEN